MRRNGPRLEGADGNWSEPLRSTGGEHFFLLMNLTNLIKACLNSFGTSVD